MYIEKAISSDYGMPTVVAEQARPYNELERKNVSRYTKGARDYVFWVDTPFVSAAFRAAAGIDQGFQEALWERFDGGPSLELPSLERCRLRDPQSTRRPPIPGCPEPRQPLDLEKVLQERDRKRRLADLVASFRATHSKFAAEEDPNQLLQYHGPVEQEIRKALRTHRKCYWQAWRDGMDALYEVFAGTLPTTLKGVLGIAQVASAMRGALEDPDSPIASHDKLVADLKRWKAGLELSTQAAFDHYVEVLFDERLSGDTGPLDVLDPDTLAYYQDMLATLFLNSGFSNDEMEAFDSVPPPVSSPELDVFPVTAEPQSFNSHDVTMLPKPPDCAHSQHEISEPSSAGTSDSQALTPSLPIEVAEIAAGVIFGLITAYLLRT